MESLVPFFIILAAGLVFSESFKRLHLPYVTALILAGILIGPVLGPVIGPFLGQMGIEFELLDPETSKADPVISFLGSIGVIFLMFIGGTEVKMGSLKSLEKDILFIVVLNSFIPFGMGFCLGWFFTQSIVESVILGIVFVSSSIAVIIPSLEVNDMIETKLGRSIITSCVFEDLGSLLLFSVVLQTAGGRTTLLPLPIFIVTVPIIVVILKILIPKLQKLYYAGKEGEDLFESKVRFVFIVLIATVILFQALDMHAIIAAFIIGIILGDSITNKVEHKIRTISYGIFIPIFFLQMGLEVPRSFLSSENALFLAFVVILGLFVSKVLSGWLAGRLLKFSNKDSWFLGFSTTPQLSTTLAAAVAATELGLLSKRLQTTLIFLAIVTTFLAPIAIRFLSPDKEESKIKL